MKGKKYKGGGHPLENRKNEDSFSLKKIWNIIFGIIWVTLFLAYCGHQHQIEHKYPNLDQTYVQVEVRLKQELAPIIMPDSELIQSKNPIRKPEGPKMYFENTYSSYKSWDEIRSWYLEKAPQYGWTFKQELIGKGIPLQLEFKKGTKDETYSLSIWKNKDDNQYVIYLSWEGITH